ncbi:recBCD enzyme subunit RecD [Geobacter sp. OR-1]|uniref:exodeoxyribonuclease V subunit alpha n=1 Tax=Geobacter sp. OR-1 TaxID=1266765 RepID=UPI0005443AA2|nr:exodeoxyribonuclease V subunit alpha [Geobacter sp. OR-1]GAM07772.1 recBCD enzyme subunit RecD [Geobacter sp. OR-1]
MTTDRTATGSTLELGVLDRVFAGFICRLANGGSRSLWLAAAFASAAAANGSVCAELDDLAAGEAVAVARAEGFGEPQDAPWLDPEQWVRELERYDVVTPPGGFAPLVLDACRRLYLHRYWSYESGLGEALLRLAADRCKDLDVQALAAGLERLFPAGKPEDGPDWQRLAAFVAARSSLAVIAGGPGTGKTTTVVKILALLLELHRGKELRIALAAPTGKAAARLIEAVSQALESLALPEEIRAGIPGEAYTLHRLLGYLPGSAGFRHHAGDPLPYDVLVVDESSMVDLPLMAKLVAAVPSRCRLLLLGDSDQLASVEPGSVLGDICHPGYRNRFAPAIHEEYAAVSGTILPNPPVVPAPPLCGSIVTLVKSRRFTESSGIAAVSRLVNEGRGAEALELMNSGSAADISWRELPAAADLATQLLRPLVDGYGEYLATGDPAECLERFGRSRILSPIRHGAYGVQQVNAIAEQALGLRTLRSGTPEWYPYRPVLVTRNDYQLGLANGDVGIALPCEDREGLYAWFPSPAGNCRRFSPLALKSCDTVFSMTVHKSQGSEFDSLLILLPPACGEILTRELIYTAITRGRKRVEIWGSEEIFVAAVDRRIQRSSGLRERLWG